MLIIESHCDNCNQSFTWKSQPYLFGKFPAGNILLSFAILCAGASVRKVQGSMKQCILSVNPHNSESLVSIYFFVKVLRVFKNMGLLGYNEVTYYYHQKHFLFPSIVSYWRTYQKNILDSLKEKEVVLAGDG